MKTLPGSGSFRGKRESFQPLRKKHQNAIVALFTVTEGMRREKYKLFSCANWKILIQHKRDNRSNQGGSQALVIVPNRVDVARAAIGCHLGRRHHSPTLVQACCGSSLGYGGGE